jgi:hypothetical protein
VELFLWSFSVTPRQHKKKEKNSVSNVVISQIKYAAGEQSHRYDEAPTFYKVAETQGLSETDGNTFGWGNYYKTEKDIIDLGLEYSVTQPLAFSCRGPMNPASPYEHPVSDLITT